MPRPHPPRLDLWPATLLSAELLHGSIVRCGPGYRMVSWPDCPEVRAATLAPQLVSHRLVAIEHTAAWVWGVLRTPVAPLTFSTLSRRCSPVLSTETMRVRQLDLAPHETLALGALRVTTPLRTVCDLLRSPQPVTRVERIATRILALRVRGGLQTVRTALQGGPRHYNSHALAKLTEL